MPSALRSNQLAFLILLQLLTLVFIQVSALPIRVRQNATTVQTVYTTQTYVAFCTTVLRGHILFPDLQDQ
jgi:uncharacterized protein YpmS